MIRLWAAMVLVLALTAQTAQARGVCHPQAAMLYLLTMLGGETFIEGYEDGPMLVQLFANEVTGSWTITGMTDAKMCIGAAGDDYRGETIDELRLRRRDAAL